MLKEAKRLYALGWACHWIKPNSKAPVKAGWSGPDRDLWETIENEYRTGFGLGVRLGASSALKEGGFLANIDIDIKSSDPRHKKEALRFATDKFPQIQVAPVVKTGYGYRFFVRTGEPTQSKKIGASNEETLVKLPTADINRRQRAAVAEGRMSEAELEAGWRVRSAWEVEFMSTGKQVVLPPSIHPDTGKPYRWLLQGRMRLEELPYIQNVDVAKARGRPPGSSVVQRFEPVVVDLVASKLSGRTVDMILNGTGVQDRSAACFSATIAMLKAGFAEIEILSVLTDRETFLGETAYDHRRTDKRGAAAAWVRDYCLRKAKAEWSAEADFAETAVETPLLDEVEASAQLEELAPERDWEDRLKRGGQPNYVIKPILENVIIILTNAVSPVVFKNDTFASREFYGCDTPWGGVAGKTIQDSDTIAIKRWLSEKFHIDVSTNIVFEATIDIARQNAFHPVRDELEALPPWDGVNRLDTWLARYCGAEGDAEYLAQVFRKWLVASITRIYEPGAKFDWIPIFEGMQGSGKSSFGAILFGQKYFSDWLPRLDDKDAALALQGKRCVEFGELESLRRNEVETIKAFITRQVDNVRPPYGRRSVEIHRQCVFFGTTNKEAYLRDNTGNRRFNPVQVGRFDFDALCRWRDQLWAEALFIYQNDFEPTLYLEGSARDVAVETQNDKKVVDETDLMTEAIVDFVEAQEAKPVDERFNFSRFKLLSLFEAMGPLARWKGDARNVQFAARALHLIQSRFMAQKTYCGNHRENPENAELVAAENELVGPKSELVEPKNNSRFGFSRVKLNGFYWWKIVKKP